MTPFISFFWLLGCLAADNRPIRRPPPGSVLVTNRGYPYYLREEDGVTTLSNPYELGQMITQYMSHWLPDDGDYLAH